MKAQLPNRGLRIRNTFPHGSRARSSTTDCTIRCLNKSVSGHQYIFSLFEDRVVREPSRLCSLLSVNDPFSVSRNTPVAREIDIDRRDRESRRKRPIQYIALK